MSWTELVDFFEQLFQVSWRTAIVLILLLLLYFAINKFVIPKFSDFVKETNNSIKEIRNSIQMIVESVNQLRMSQKVTEEKIKELEKDSDITKANFEKIDVGLDRTLSRILSFNQKALEEMQRSIDLLKKFNDNLEDKYNGLNKDFIELKTEHKMYHSKTTKLND